MTNTTHVYADDELSHIPAEELDAYLQRLHDEAFTNVRLVDWNDL